MTTPRDIDSAIERLARYIRHHGHVRTARVSSAQASGAAKSYSYWGVARYHITTGARDGLPINVPVERAASDRRAWHLAYDDLLAVCEAEHRIECQRIGHLSERDAAAIISALHLTGVIS